MKFLNKIYGTFSHAMLKVVPVLRAYAELQIFKLNELTRWMRGIFETIKSMESLSLEDLIRIWAQDDLEIIEELHVIEE